MPPRPLDASPTLPAFVLALVLLAAFAALGVFVLGKMQMVPGTLMPAAPAPVAAKPNKNHAPQGNIQEAQSPIEPGPGWETLNTPQKLALYPLAERWAQISEPQKRRWLALAATFSTLPEEEQAKFHSRITDWASLSAQQRNQARLNYAVTNKLARDTKQAQWEAYQALTEAQKQALAARADPKPKGAATALRPSSPGKLAQVPAATAGNPNRPNVPKISSTLENLPHRAAPIIVDLPSSAGPAAAPNPLPTIVETAPVHIPEATPLSLPPLDAPPHDAGARTGSTVPPALSNPSSPSAAVTPDTSGLYPQ